jgi:hypothetical protein
MRETMSQEFNDWDYPLCYISNSDEMEAGGGDEHREGRSHQVDY